MNALWTEYSSNPTRKRHTTTMQWRTTFSYSTLFFRTQQFWICTSRAKTPLEVNCTSDDLVTLRAVATQVSSSFHSHHQHSWLRSLAVCSGAAGRCDAFIISAIIFLQHLHTEYLYQDIFLGSFTILLHPVFMWCCPMLTWHNLIQRSKWDIVCETGHGVSPPTGWRAESLHRAADVRLR